MIDVRCLVVSNGLLALVSTLLLGCVSHVRPRGAVTVGCLEVAVTSRSAESSSATVVRFDFTNRCDVQVTVDLRSVRVVARDVAGREHVLEPYDPRHEIRALPIDAQTYGDELIEYRSSLEGTVQGIHAICIDVAAVDGRARSSSTWVCTTPRTAVAS